MLCGAAYLSRKDAARTRYVRLRCMTASMRGSFNSGAGRQGQNASAHLSSRGTLYWTLRTLRTNSYLRHMRMDCNVPNLDAGGLNIH